MGTNYCARPGARGSPYIYTSIGIFFVVKFMIKLSNMYDVWYYLWKSESGKLSKLAVIRICLFSKSLKNSQIRRAKALCEVEKK